MDALGFEGFNRRQDQQFNKRRLRAQSTKLRTGPTIHAHASRQRVFYDGIFIRLNTNNIDRKDEMEMAEAWILTMKQHSSP